MVFYRVKLNKEFYIYSNYTGAPIEYRKEDLVLKLREYEASYLKKIYRNLKTILIEEVFDDGSVNKYTPNGIFVLSLMQVADNIEDISSGRWLTYRNALNVFEHKNYLEYPHVFFNQSGLFREFNNHDVARTLDHSDFVYGTDWIYAFKNINDASIFKMKYFGDKTFYRELKEDKDRLAIGYKPWYEGTL